MVAADRTTDKADYYRQTLESERASREAADNQIIDLLHNVKNRYDSKLSAYMGRNSKAKQANNSKNDSKQSSTDQADSWGSSDIKQSPDDQQQPADDDGWGTQTTTSAVNWGTDTPAKKDKGKKDKAKKNKSDSNDTWGASDNKLPDEQQPADDDGWGTQTTTSAVNWGSDTPGKKDKGKKDKSDSNDTWGNSDNKSPGEQQQAVDDGWATKATTSTEDWGTGTPAKKDKGKKNKSDSKDTWSAAASSWDNSDNKSPDEQQPADDDASQANKADGDGWATKTTTSAANWGSDKPAAKDKSKKDKAKKNKSDSNDNWGASENKSPEKQQPANDAASRDSKAGEKVDTKEFLEMKSQMWTLKLDLRLLDRDKAKLTEQVGSLTQERDNLLKKLDAARQEHDSMKVRMRGLTVDLVSANEEIHKLNERIDEIEAEKRNKEKESFVGESKRRAIENKYKEHQQQIANLESELNLLKEEKEEYVQRISELERRNDRLLGDLNHSKNLVRTLKDGCAMVEDQVKTYEVRHDSVVMSKADMERELIAIKEESSRHITTINKLQKSNEQLVNAFMMSSEAHDETKRELETIQKEYGKRLQAYKNENHRLSEANNQLTKLIDYLRAGKR